MNAILTIAIPTYNRNLKLNRSLSILVPQLNEHTKLVIYDNASCNEVASTIPSEMQKNIKIIRNPVNIGAQANINKCIVECETEWLWVLGDDDPPMISSVSQILSDIRSTPEDVVFINYKTHMSEFRTKSYDVCGVDDLIKKMDSFGNLLFISTNIFNTKKLRGGLRWIHLFAYSFAAQLAYLLSGICHQKAIFSCVPIINVSLYDTKPDETWNPIPISKNICILYELPIRLHPKTKMIFYNHLGTHRLSNNAISNELLKLKSEHFKINDALYFYDQNILRWTHNMTFVKYIVYRVRRQIFIFRFNRFQYSSNTQLYNRI
jgi:glycosyltransferase involved in cell wall biosynthesis